MIVIIEMTPEEALEQLRKSYRKGHWIDWDPELDAPAYGTDLASVLDTYNDGIPLEGYSCLADLEAHVVLLRARNAAALATGAEQSLIRGGVKVRPDNRRDCREA